MFFKLRVQVEQVIDDTIWAGPCCINYDAIFFVEQIAQLSSEEKKHLKIITIKGNKMGTRALLMTVKMVQILH